MGLSFSHLVLVSVVVLLLFGARRLPSVMGDLAKGYRAFVDGLKEKDSSNSSDDHKPPMV